MDFLPFLSSRVIPRSPIGVLLPLFLQGVLRFLLGSLTQTSIDQLLNNLLPNTPRLRKIPHHRYRACRRNPRVDPIPFQRVANRVRKVGYLAHDGDEASGVQQVVVCPVGAVGVYFVDGVIPCVAIQVRVA